VVLTRLGCSVRYVCGVLPRECCPELRAPLVGEGIQVAPFLLSPAAGHTPPLPFETAEDEDEEPGELRPTLAAETVGDGLLLTLELPDAELLEALELCRGDQRLLALHLAPGREVPPTALAEANLLLAGEAEAGQAARSSEERLSQKGLLRRLGAFGPGRSVVLGPRGATLFDGERFFEAEAPAPGQPGLAPALRQAVFSAVLCAALAEGRRVERALGAALAAAALPPSAEGPFPDLPSTEGLLAALADSGSREGRGDHAH
jgi:sugar/nucleoside kinase (ribokinase family)